MIFSYILFPMRVQIVAILKFICQLLLSVTIFLPELPYVLTGITVQKQMVLIH